MAGGGNRSTFEGLITQEGGGIEENETSFFDGGDSQASMWRVPGNLNAAQSQNYTGFNWANKLGNLVKTFAPDCISKCNSLF